MEKIVKSGLRDCTVTLDGSECSVKFDSCFRVFAVRNDSAADVFISKASGIVPDADGVMCVKSGASAVFAHMDIYADTVYLLGTGKVQVHAQNDTANPFNFAPTFDGGVQASGNPIQMDNLQGGVPFSEIVVSGKNLYDNSIIVGMIASSTGEMITTTSKYLSTNGYVAVKPNEKYVLSNAENKDYDTVVFYDENKNYISSYVYGIGGIPVPRGFITPANCHYVRWRYYMDGETATVDMLTNIQLELGTTPTEYEQPITGRDLTVNVCGKNLLNNEQASVASAGVTITKNSDGTVTLNGTSTADVWLLFTTKCPIVKDKAYTFSSGISFDDNMIFGIRSEDITDSYMQTRTYGSFVSPTTGFCRIRAYAAKDTTFNNLIIRPQLEIGSTATPYEPYSGSVTTITPDSNPYVVPNDIRQQDGLNNISVSEGELTVTGVRKNAAIKKIWDKLDELTMAIIVSNGESE